MPHNYRIKNAPYGLRLLVPVEESPGRRKLTREAWAKIEKHFGLPWHEIVVIGCDTSRGPFEIWSGGRLLAELLREPVELPNTCPKCIRTTRFVRTALICPEHGCVGGF